MISEEHIVHNSPESISTGDPVNPQHYKASVECITLMEELFGEEEVRSFCKLNAFKYMFRHTSKNGDEDLKKAQWYLNRYFLYSHE